MRNKLILLSTVSILCGCQTVGNLEEQENSKTNGSKISARLDQRPKCDYGFSLFTKYYTNISRFYKETKHENSVGQPINEGAILFYGQYIETDKFATSPELIENKDKSPLNRNWAWKQGQSLPVLSMVTVDSKNWWYLISSQTSSYWTASDSGMLCGNVLAFDDNYGLTTAYGMSDIYQTKPISFNERIKNGAPPISLSVSVKKVTGAAAELAFNVMKGGRAVYTASETVDLIGGEFSVAKIRFSTKRDGSNTILKSVNVPNEIGPWLHFDLKINQHKWQ
jgi:hypothetical protein